MMTWGISEYLSCFRVQRGLKVLCDNVKGEAKEAGHPPHYFDGSLHRHGEKECGLRV